VLPESQEHPHRRGRRPNDDARNDDKTTNTEKMDSPRRTSSTTRAGVVETVHNRTGGVLPHWTKETAVLAPVIADATAMCSGSRIRDGRLGAGLRRKRCGISRWRRAAGPGLTRTLQGEKRGWWRHDSGVRTEGGRRARGEKGGWRRREDECVRGERIGSVTPQVLNYRH
jgi:hypothetical protein